MGENANLQGTERMEKEETDDTLTHSNLLNRTLTEENVKRKWKLDKILFDTSGMVW